MKLALGVILLLFWTSIWVLDIDISILTGKLRGNSCFISCQLLRNSIFFFAVNHVYERSDPPDHFLLLSYWSYVTTRKTILNTQCKQETSSGITHTNRAAAHSTPKPKPLSIQPINTFKVISYNTLTMTFVTTFNCNTIDNICAKTCKPLGSRNGHSDFVNKYSSNQSPKMAHASRNMSL
jgi:hypothetical protein